MSANKETEITITIEFEREEEANSVDTFLYHFIKTLHIWVVTGVSLTGIGLLLSLAF